MCAKTPLRRGFLLTLDHGRAVPGWLVPGTTGREEPAGGVSGLIPL